MSDNDEIEKAILALAETFDEVFADIDKRLAKVEAWQREWDEAAEAWESGEVTVMFTPEFDGKKTH